jgi:uncharacterized RDD family membrane protein YckC
MSRQPHDPYFDPIELPGKNPFAAPQADLKPDWFGDFATRQGGRRVLASPLTRLGARLVDGVLALALFLLGLAVGFLGKAGLDGVGTADELAESLPAFFLIVAGLGFQVIQWYLIATTGQSLGKKIVGIRIVQVDSGALPGFLKGVFLREWVPQLIQAIPLLGTIFGLVDPLFIFGDERRCLHDYIASTEVVVA